MQLGAVFPQMEIGSDPIKIRDYAQAVEQMRCRSLMAYEHVLCPGASHGSSVDYRVPHTNRYMTLNIPPDPLDSGCWPPSALLPIPIFLLSSAKVYTLRHQAHLSDCSRDIQLREARMFISDKKVKMIKVLLLRKRPFFIICTAFLMCTSSIAIGVVHASSNGAHTGAEPTTTATSTATPVGTSCLATMMTATPTTNMVDTPTVTTTIPPAATPDVIGTPTLTITATQTAAPTLTATVIQTSVPTPTVTGSPTMTTSTSNAQPLISLADQTLSTTPGVILKETIMLQNGGTQPLTWVATIGGLNGGNWLSISAPGSTLQSGESMKLDLTLTTQGLMAGTYTGQVQFTTTGGNQILTIHLIISSALSTAGPCTPTPAFGTGTPRPKATPTDKDGD